MNKREKKKKKTPCKTITELFHDAEEKGSHSISHQSLKFLPKALTTHRPQKEPGDGAGF